MSIETLIADLIAAVKENTAELKVAAEQRERAMAAGGLGGKPVATEDKPKRGPGRPPKNKVEEEPTPEPEQDVAPVPADPVALGEAARKWIEAGGAKREERKATVKAIVTWAGGNKLGDLDADGLEQFAEKFAVLVRDGKVDLNSDPESEDDDI